jgi:hypothetical protein
MCGNGWLRKLDTMRLTSAGQDEEPLETTFELNETLYTKAEIPPTKEVYLWLGVGLSELVVTGTAADGKSGQRHALLSDR